jgi:lysophospholipase L1-like esterase
MNEVVKSSATLTDTSSKVLLQVLRTPATSGISEESRLLAFLVGPGHTDEEEEQVIAGLEALFSTEAKDTLLVFDGDSQTSGHNESGSIDERDLAWPYVLMQSLADETVHASNMAVSSMQIVDGTGNPDKDMNEWAAEKIDSQLHASYSQDILIVMAGRNDIGVIDAAGAGETTYERLVAYCQARTAAGWDTIIVVNAIPDKPLTDAGWASEVADYNSRIASNGLTDWDAVVDAASLNWQPGGPTDWTTNYQSTTGLHPNAAGRTLIADAVQAVLEGFL